mgnify:CR=1 FL=1
MLQRVCAALGPGWASIRRSSGVTPEVSAAKVRRRVAVRSSARGLRHSSITAAPTEAQRTTSTAARSNVTGSGKTTSTIRRRSTPISASPGPYRHPVRSTDSSRSQNNGAPAWLAKHANIIAKPDALPLSAGSFAKSSCSRPRARPPPIAASRPAYPSDATAAASFGFSARAIFLCRAHSAFTDSIERMFFICSNRTSAEAKSRPATHPYQIGRRASLSP